ncbi:uncharacterized protein LOC114323498 [Camellia sinensis]|uniref:uncharacterized protein LOC114323498 n=1 Tax=Camellia sinensis TaxID=4442 RepID=UPI0010357217|nr:uncharacterized protein LOC114323498 [Camellia sinensis]
MNADTTIGSAEVTSAIIRNSIFHTDVARQAKQSDVAVFSQALHFSLVGLFSTYEAMAYHDRMIKATDKLKTSRDRQNERVNELELWLVASEGKTAEVEKKLHTMDFVLKSSSQEIIALKEEKK